MEANEPRTGCAPWAYPKEGMSFILSLALYAGQDDSTQSIQKCVHTNPLPWRQHLLFIYLFNIFYWLCYYSCPIFFLTFIPLHPVHPFPPSFLHLSSCLWVIHVSSLASPFPIPFLTSPCLFYAYQLCFLFTVPFPPFFPSASPLVNLPCDLFFVILFLF